MSKLGSDGKPIYDKNGKVQKGPNYFKPDLSKFVANERYILLYINWYLSRLIVLFSR